MMVKKCAVAAIVYCTNADKHNYIFIEREKASRINIQINFPFLVFTTPCSHCSIIEAAASFLFPLD